MSSEKEGEQPLYISTDDSGNITLEPDSHITPDNIDIINFKFVEGTDITESVSKKNAKNKTPVSFTKKGRTAYAPVTVVYPDGVSESSKFLLEGCVIQYSIALNAQTHSYAKEFVIIGIPTVYLDKIMQDAKDNSSINLENKSNVSERDGCYWLSCSLEKLSHRNIQIITEDGPVNISLEIILKEAKMSLMASVVFVLSGSMSNNDMGEELDLKDGTYYISMKPTEVFITETTDIKGPELTDTNKRKKESSGMSQSFLATGTIASIAARRLKGGRKM